MQFYTSYFNKCKTNIKDIKNTISTIWSNKKLEIIFTICSLEKYARNNEVLWADFFNKSIYELNFITNLYNFEKWLKQIKIVYI